MALAGLVLYWMLKDGAKLSRRGMTVFIVLLTALTWTELFSMTAPTNSQLVPGSIISHRWFSQPSRFCPIANGLLPPMAELNC